MSNIHKLFQLETDIGLLTLEIIKFTNYAWIIITDSNRLEIDGGIQVGIKTPYEHKATVINIAQDEHQVQKQYQQLCRLLSSDLGYFVVMSVNTMQIMSINDIKKVNQAIKVTLKSQQMTKNIQAKKVQNQKQAIQNSEQTKVVSKLQGLRIE